MWADASMGAPENIFLSVMGLNVVMATLTILALVILVLVKVMRSSNAAAQSTPKLIPDPPGISGEVCSMVLVVICEELHVSPEEINATSIKELR